MPDFPTSVPVFTDLVDNQDDVLAEHQNTPNDEISAIATLVGALGKSQSWAVDFISAQLNGTPVRLVKKDANTITAKAGVCWIANSGQTIRLPRRNTVDVDITASDIDTGALANNTFYYVYAYADSVGTTMAFKFSTSATTPTGLTSYELVGWFYNEGAGSLTITNGYVGNVKKGIRTGVVNAVFRNGTTADAINDTSYGSDLTEASVAFYSSGRPVLILFNLSGTLSTGLDFDLILDIDGSDDSASETKWGGTGGGVRSGAQMSYMFVPAAGGHLYTIQAKVGSGTYNVLSKKLQVIEL